ncbi:hypothetical protein [Actinoplanes teichomyceticus]|uniref:Lipoprotein LprG n=1 Tax=Actinoplanes teichomyceticus TaxID=1867 RepID=A0A561VJ80_ACTTI|nr:hypothetical protein [Actinoplanes teichomyceticus]TWG11650.1 hypothetical protein FHX34_106380 [Actinoplanes teichomyceticus]GIF15489.1 lipoprotein [Actinoplanes teichomyceticus]
MKTVSRAALAALTMTAVLLAGCGSDDSGDKAPADTATAANGVADLEAAAILDRAKAALKGAKSFHVKGVMSDEGSVTNLDLKVAGTDVAGSIEFGGAKLEMLSVGGHRYMRPNDKFWTMMDSSGQMAKTMASQSGKWIKPADNDTSLGAFFGAADIDELLKPEGTVTKGEAKTVDGAPAIGLVDSGDAKSVLYVATTGEPYPIKMERPAPEGLAFSEFGATFADIKEPAATDVIEMPKQ